MEGEGGRFRRNHCVPMPVVDSIEELNAVLEAADDADDARRIGNRANSVGHDWAFEKTLLRPLPAEPFDTALTLAPRVDRYAQVMMRCNQYSVPAQGMPGPARSPDARRVRQFGGRVVSLRRCKRSRT